MPSTSYHLKWFHSSAMCVCVLCYGGSKTPIVLHLILLDFIWLFLTYVMLFSLISCCYVSYYYVLRHCALYYIILYDIIYYILYYIKSDYIIFLILTDTSWSWLNFKFIFKCIWRLLTHLRSSDCAFPTTERRLCYLALRHHNDKQSQLR